MEVKKKGKWFAQSYEGRWKQRENQKLSYSSRVCNALLHTLSALISVISVLFNLMKTFCSYIYFLQINFWETIEARETKISLDKK